MAAVRPNARLQVGSISWVAEERSSALQIADAETEEFTFSARNEVDWLNEHMAEIFSKNQVNVAQIFKTPGKLRGKTPRTVRKGNPLEARAPLSDVFSATPQAKASPFRQIHFERPVSSFRVAEDDPMDEDIQVLPITSKTQHKSPSRPIHSALDSGYYGSQADDVTQANQSNDPFGTHHTPRISPPKLAPIESPQSPGSESDSENVVILGRDSDEPEERRTTEGSFQSAREEQMRTGDAPEREAGEDEHIQQEHDQPSYPVLESPLEVRNLGPASPEKRSPIKPSPIRPSPAKLSPNRNVQLVPEEAEEDVPEEDQQMEEVQSPDVHSPSDSSSPLRPIVRKSSLNFASLPAREPLTTKKSIGNRVSRISQLEQSRTSHYGRQTGGKSLGNAIHDGEDEDDEMEVDETIKDDTDTKMSRLHNKTSTQRLQDQISMLGQSQANVRPSKSFASSSVAQSQPSQPLQPLASQDLRQKSPDRQKSPGRKSRLPGAFPDDEEDSWIGPPPAAPEPAVFSPRPPMTKSHTTDVMEQIHGKESVGGEQFNIPKRGDQLRNPSPTREPIIPERTTSTLGHMKSVSTSVLRSPKKAGDSPGQKKGISVSNPTPSIHTIEEGTTASPPKSPSRSYKGSPLKAAKDKFSSILKTSRGLFASSAAVSAEAKSSALASASSRMGMMDNPSLEDVLSQSNNINPVYPNLTKNYMSSQQSLHSMISPFKSSPRKTRASTEREVKEAREVKETKEAQKMNDQLEKARMKVKEDARVFHMEQERVAAMQKEISSRKEQENLAKASQVEPARPTRTSPRKTKAQLEAEGIAAAAASTDELADRDVEMSEPQASQAMPPPSIPRPKSQIGRPGAKRPTKPAAKEMASKGKPTVIRVDTGSQRGHHNHPSTSTLAASLQDSLASSQQSAPSQGLKHKASTSSIQSKSSTNSFKSAAAKALESAARKKEQDELAAQKKREAKQEVERQRAAIKEEERRKEEQQRRDEVERQREMQKERERANALADAKKSASRQAIEKRRLEMEKAKETRAPPPAIRPQASADLARAMDKALPPVPQQRSDLGQSKPPRMVNGHQRPQEDMGRSVNTSMQNSTKAPPKRPLQQDTDDFHSRPTLQRSGPSYQEQQAKRARLTPEFEDEDDLTEDHPKMTAPPIRQSSVRQKDAPTKSLFPSGYANAPPPTTLQRSTLISQHQMNQTKPAHPMDMAQLSKAPIPFASSSNHGNAQPHKTPARPGAPYGAGKSAAKSGARSSPRYQNPEEIELDEIHTDSEDEDSENDGDKMKTSAWVESPALRKAIIEQEGTNPADIFGLPGALNMEEVFSKSKDRFHKFRARTSSANWSGQDRLTEDEIKRDIEARDKLRRQGGWTYDSMV
ncbi:related to vesicular transport-associated repeat protein Tb-291 [Rhynchosporium graminicola]|uniref:Related to vesicular transport-associated repeat protein Tb-291 n=1 Tax=Rhynchosporium graminicola TaxID=2792576 RepID=A0A1E1KVL5_9HELO|nr:related to vesicular transport-associated repeat protein Tb-291 [Rhynchosporium commune]